LGCLLLIDLDDGIKKRMNFDTVSRRDKYWYKRSVIGSATAVFLIIKKLDCWRRGNAIVVRQE
jgi:hypothetical protein